MKRNKLIAALATAAGLVAMGSAHAIAPAAAAAAGSLGGAVAGSAAAHATPPAVAVVPAPPVAVVPSDSTVVMGGPPVVVQEVVPAPRAGYRWERGHYEVRSGVSAWVPGQWVSNEVIIYQ